MGGGFRLGACSLALQRLPSVTPFVCSFRQAFPEADPGTEIPGHGFHGEVTPGSTSRGVEVSPGRGETAAVLMSRLPLWAPGILWCHWALWVTSEAGTAFTSIH